MDIKTSIQTIIRSETFRGVIIGLVIASVVLLIFQAGVAVGERRSGFAHRFGDNFERNFRGPESRMMIVRDVSGNLPLPGSHGVAGKIVSVLLPQIIVARPDNLEQTVLVDSSTVIREFERELSASELRAGEHIVVVGQPDAEGQINAKLIRVLPSPMDPASHTQPSL